MWGGMVGSTSSQHQPGGRSRESETASRQREEERARKWYLDQLQQQASQNRDKHHSPQPPYQRPHPPTASQTSASSHRRPPSSHTTANINPALMAQTIQGDTDGLFSKNSVQCGKKRKNLNFMNFITHEQILPKDNKFKQEPSKFPSKTPFQATTGKAKNVIKKLHYY